MSEKKKIETYDHELMPKHVLLNQEEINELLTEYGISPYQLSRIKLSDPATREIKAKPGDIIKIIRKSQTAGETIAYRYVVKG